MVTAVETSNLTNCNVVRGALDVFLPPERPNDVL
jgi:hypothetical protein